MVIETCVVTDSKDWWIDTGATTHICCDRNLFSTYEKVDDGERLYMENAIASTIEGKGNMIIKFTSEKEMTLLNVLHILKIRKNLVSRPMLSKKGFKLVFEFD